MSVISGASRRGEIAEKLNWWRHAWQTFLTEWFDDHKTAEWRWSSDGSQPSNINFVPGSLPLCRSPFAGVALFSYTLPLMPNRSSRVPLKKLASFASIRLRGVVKAPNQKRHTYCEVTTILRKTHHFRFWQRHISRWRRRRCRQPGRGGAFFPFSTFFQCFTCASLFRNKVHTVILWFNGLCDIRVLLCTM